MSDLISSDFDEVKRIFKPTLDKLDHNYLNDIKGWKTQQPKI